MTDRRHPRHPRPPARLGCQRRRRPHRRHAAARPALGERPGRPRCGRACRPRGSAGVRWPTGSPSTATSRSPCCRRSRRASWAPPGSSAAATGRTSRRAFVVRIARRRHGTTTGRERLTVPRGRRRRAAERSSLVLELTAQGLRPAARHADQRRRRGLRRRRAAAHAAGAVVGDRAARLLRPVGARAQPAAHRVHARHAAAREPARPHRLRLAVRAGRRDGGLRQPHRRGLGAAHGLVRQPPHRSPSAATTTTGLLGGGELLGSGEVRLARGESYTSPWVYGSWGVGLDALADRFHAWMRARPQHPTRPRPVTLNTWEAVYFQHDLGPADGARRRRGRRRCRAVRARRRLVRRPARRHPRAGGLVRVRGRVARRPAPAGRARHGTRAAVRALGRAGDGQPRLRPGPRAPRLDPARPGAAAPRGAPPAGARPRRAGGLRVHPRAARRAADRVRRSATSSGTTTATWSTPGTGERPACTGRRSRSTGCWTSCARCTRAWRSSRARPAVRGSTWRSCSAPTGCGPATASTRSSASRSSAGPTC